MNLAAVTMVYEGYATLARWYEHYGKLVGYQNLYIVSHGDDPEHRKIAEKANVIGIPRTGLKKFDWQRAKALHGLNTFLEIYFDAVVRTDVDEFVFFDPERYSSLAECLKSIDCDAWFCAGFNVFAEPDDDLLQADKLISEQRKRCLCTPMYCKAIASRNGMVLRFHGAVDPRRDSAEKMAMPVGLYLAHIKHAEAGPTGLIDSKTDASRGRYGARRVVGQAQAYELLDGDEVLSEFYADMSSGFGKFREKRPGIWVVPQEWKKRAFALPDRFVGCF